VVCRGSVRGASQEKRALCLAEARRFKRHWSDADFFYVAYGRTNTPQESSESDAKGLDLCRQGEVFAYFKHEEGPEGASRAEAMLDDERQLRVTRVEAVLHKARLNFTCV